MSDLSGLAQALPPEQQAIRAKCFHPSGVFTEFKREEIEQSIPDRFEQMVAKYPDRIAVKGRKDELAYGELNQMANRIARAILARRGEGNEPIVLLLEQDAGAIAAILGVLKAGKTYVPLDPSYPHARLAYMLEDSQAGLIVTNQKNLSLANELAKHKLALLNVNEFNSSLSPENLRLSISPDTPACIRYTSGSTGQPKGVVENHRQRLYNVMKHTNSAHICADDRVTLLSAYSFAIGVNALLNGAALYPFNIKEKGLTYLVHWLIHEEITIYYTGATIFRYLASTLTGEKQFPKLRLIYFSGEPVYKRDIELYRKHFSPDCLLVSSIGATEAGVFRMCFLDKETEVTGSIVPVGYAVEDMEVLLLDNDGKEVGFNQIGEISIKSRYFSPSYWRRPDLTQAKFLPDSNGGDERIYLTGDLGRMLPDGCLEHLGRKDFQVKIRGYRIDPIEIEAVLGQHPGVRDTVVLAREDEPGDPSAALPSGLSLRVEDRTGKRLVAYVVPSQAQAPAASDLRNFLKERLPDYMVPSAFVLLDALPLLPNGKLDRQRLPDIDNSRPNLDTPFVVPKTAVEQTLVKIWVEVLNVDQVGIHDNFFDLGGHSLAATRIISQVKKHFQVELPLRLLFQSPTVAEMANVIAEYQGKNLGNEELENILADLESLTDEEAQRIVRGGVSKDSNYRK